MPAEPRRAILLRRSEADAQDTETLVEKCGLVVVYTITCDSDNPRLAAMIAIQHVIDHRAEVVIAPHLTAEDMRTSREWRALTELVDVVIGGGETYFARP